MRRRQITPDMRIAVEPYNELIRDLGNDGPTTRIAMERMAKEEEPAGDMKKLLETLSRDERFAEGTGGSVNWRARE